MDKPKETKEFIYDRVIAREISIFSPDEKFCLSDGYYFNEDKTIFIKSTDFTGKLFRQDGSKRPI